MKGRTIILTALTLTGILLTGCAANQAKINRIDIETAKSAAIEAAGVSAGEVDFHSVELDRRNGIEYYDVDFYANGQEYEYDIDAFAGTVIGSKAPEADKPLTDSGKKTVEPSVNNNVASDSNNQAEGNEITEAEAKKIALEQVPGAEESDIRQFKIDYDDGKLEYEGSIYYNELEYEFEIDGYSGAIRSWEVESIYD